MWLISHFLAVFLYLGNQVTSLDFKPESTTKLGPCQTCRVFSESFLKGLERTAREKHAGGDANWEETRLANYASSEVRLVEIQEELCKDLKHGKDQCHNLANEQEHLIEDWWFKYQKDNPDIYLWLCISELKVCCPAGHFGPDCLPCTANPENPCSGHGKCKGSGTRKGNGDCVCHKGYKGALCEQCDGGYFLTENSTCSKCHKSCLGECVEDGPSGCMACQSGWIMNSEFGCVDFNECIETDKPCDMNEFCVNNEGSHSCIECDKSCNTCFGDGPDSCNECAAGYQKQNNLCIDTRTVKSEDELTKARYFTYAGLTVATCIIFQKNTYIASIVGVIVATYVALSEYALH